MKFISLFTTNGEILIESLELLAIIYSILTIYVVYKILKEIDFEDRQTILPISILTFHPLFIFLAREVNTDGLVTLLTLISVLFLIKWYKEPTYKNLLILAMSIGLGAMTKTSIIVMAVTLIFVYIKKIGEIVEDSKIVKKIIIQGILFSFITVPMVFWYQVRNNIRFGQPIFGIVEGLEILKVADNSFFARWVLNHEIFNVVLEYNASNVWANLIISSINFAILSDEIPFWISMVLRGISLIFISISIISMFKYTIKGNNKNLFSILTVTYIIWIIGYIFFNISLPYSCTMHARYITTAFVIGVIYIGVFYNNLKSKESKYFIFGLSLIFILLSILMFIYLIFEKNILIH